MADEYEQVEQTETEQAENQTEETKSEEQAKEETVPMERFEEVNAKLRELEETNSTLGQDLALLKANSNQPQGQAPQPFDILREVGLDPDDEDAVPTAKQLKQINDHNQGRANAMYAEIMFKLDHPDFAQVVGTEDQMRSGRFAQPLQEAIKDNPTLLATIQNSKEPKIAAYGLAKLYVSKKETAAAKDEDTPKIKKKEAEGAIDEAVKNANQVKSSSVVAGGAALSEDGRYEAMSDEAFLQLAESHGAQV